MAEKPNSWKSRGYITLVDWSRDLVTEAVAVEDNVSRFKTLDTRFENATEISLKRYSLVKHAVRGVGNTRTHQRLQKGGLIAAHLLLLML